MADEMVNCLHAESAGVLRYESDGTVTVVAVHPDPPLPEGSILGTRWSPEGDDVLGKMLSSGRAARWDGHDVAGPLAARGSERVVRCVVGVPVVVDGTCLTVFRLMHDTPWMKELSVAEQVHSSPAGYLCSAADERAIG